MNSRIIYTDGGCHGNPGPGAWAFVLYHDSGRIEESGGEKNTTNNRMELTAVIRALDRVSSLSKSSLGQNSGKIIIYTDSQYVKNGITTWIHSWSRNGWKTSAKKPVKNKDLWVELQKLNDILKPEWHWVKGHAGNEGNELCDSLVQDTILSITSR
jgi:ribonuclease HI